MLFKKIIGEKYDLRCKNRNYNGRAQYEVESGEITITQECSINLFKDHNYIKEKLFIDKLKANNIKKEELENKYNQKYFFKCKYFEYKLFRYYLSIK